MCGPPGPAVPLCGLAGCCRPARFSFTRATDAPAYGPVWQQALRVAAIVGTLLFAINQADVVVRGQITPVVVAKIALTYIVPFCVSTYSALGVNRLRGQRA